MMQGKTQQLLGTYDPSTPFVETDNEVVEISTAPVDASVFDIPGDYQPATLADLLKASRPAPPVPTSTPPANFPPPPSSLPGTP